MQGVFDQRRTSVGSAPTVVISAQNQAEGAHARGRATAERRACAVTLGALSFLATYMAVHASFIMDRAPSSIMRLSQVPLFATALTSSGVAASIAILGLLLIEDGKTLLPRLKAPLAVITVLFVLEILLAP